MDSSGLDASGPVQNFVMSATHQSEDDGAVTDQPSIRHFTAHLGVQSTVPTCTASTAHTVSTSSTFLQPPLPLQCHCLTMRKCVPLLGGHERSDGCLKEQVSVNTGTEDSDGRCDPSLLAASSRHGDSQFSTTRPVATNR